MTEQNNPSNMGTYNYGDQAGHLFYDVMPWWHNGNAANDPTSHTDRTWLLPPGGAIHAHPLKISEDQQAYDHREAVKEKIQSEAGMIVPSD